MLKGIHKRVIHLKQRNIDWAKIAGFVFFVVVVFGFIQISLSARSWMHSRDDSPIQNIEVFGETRYVEADHVIKTVKHPGLGSFFSVDVNDIQRRVESLPWVYKASVRKQWPKTLKIFITEQIPAAYWNEDFFVNQQGELFEANTQNVTEVLPNLFGPMGSESEALTTYQDLNKLLAFDDYQITSLALSERYAWQIWLSNGIRLDLGRKDIAKRINRFVEHYPAVLEHSPASVDYVDLRYDTGMSIGWKTEEKKS